MLDLGLLLAQLIVVLLVARLSGRLVKLLGQPAVVGEMIAGLALGPSVFGAVAPAAMHTLFPTDKLLPLATLSQLGVVLFMFVVGLRLDLSVLRCKARTAVAVSHAGIVAPFLLGVALANLLHADLAPPGVAFLPFALFMGAAMSITAFPVLARILDERKMLNSRIGAIAIAAAAIDDATAWCILAAVLAVATATANGGSGWSTFAVTLGSTLAYVLLIAFGLRPILTRWATGVVAKLKPATAPFATDVVTSQMVSIAVVGALASAWTTEMLGVHALFGAFVAGAVVPRIDVSTRPAESVHAIAGSNGQFAPTATPAINLSDAIANRIDSVVSAVLLPVFFAFVGLRTSVGLISGAGLWTVFALILLVAVSGKMGGAAAAAKLTGLGWRDALSIGALMNTRGLMELVILNVGLDIGVISPALFAMMVLMALVTTVMTSPLVAWLYRAPDEATAFVSSAPLSKPGRA
ncbi:MAG: cation:proton antiporter [Phycisphaerae bacterium]|nr:cation:proton antiporter [Gemmatimonadaceae bacterium]